jgi:hypothetical protein
LWCVFGITERFERTVRSDVARKAAHWHGGDEAASWFLRAWDREEFDVISPPALDVRGAGELALAVEQIYSTGYPNGSVSVAAKCIQEWRADPLRNPRRLIRLLVHRLDLGRKLHLSQADSEKRVETAIASPNTSL